MTPSPRRVSHAFPAALALILAVCMTLAPLLSGCAANEPVTKNVITSIRLSDAGKNGQTLTVYGALTADQLTRTPGKVYLFALTPDEVLTVGNTLSGLDPVAEVNPKGSSSVRFRLPLEEGLSTHLYDSFVLAVKQDGQYVPLTMPTAIPDSELAASKGSAAPAERSIKGLISDFPADAISLGVSHALIEVPVDELILSDFRADALSYVSRGVTAYIDGTRLAALDKQILAYTSAGVNVLLQFTLSGQGEAPLCLYMGGTRRAGAAVNMAEPQTVALLEGFFEFIAARYASGASEIGRGLCSAFIIGRGVNAATPADCPGDGSLTAYAANCEALVRLVHTALRRQNASGRTYVSLNSDWDGTSLGGWGIGHFLAAFVTETARRGSYDWQVAAEMFAPAPSITTPDSAVDDRRLTIHSLTTLTDLLSGTRFLDAEGNPRRPIISRLDVPSASDGKTDETAQAVSYAYAYTAAAASGQVDALIYGTYARRDDASGAGLCAAFSSSDGTLTLRRRTVYDIFRVIDTTASSSVDKAMASLLGTAYTRLEEQLMGRPRPVERITASASLRPLEEKGTPLFTFRAGDDHGFTDAGSLTYTRLVNSETLNRPYLQANFDRLSLSDPMGLSVRFGAVEVIGATQLSVSLFAGPAGTVDNGTSVTLRLTRAAKGALTDGDGTLILEAAASDLRAGVWQTAVFDVKDFTSRLDAEDDVVMTLWINGNDGASYTMGLDAVTVTGVTAHSPAVTAVIIAVVVIALLIAAAVAFLALRKRFRRR